MARDDIIANSLTNTFQALIDEETHRVPTSESPIILKKEGASLSLVVHDSIHIKINELSKRLNVSRDDAQAAFVSAVLDGLLPKVGISVEQSAFDKVIVERKSKLINIPVKVVHTHSAGYQPFDNIHVHNKVLDSSLHTPKQAWKDVTPDGILVEKPVEVVELRRQGNVCPAVALSTPINFNNAFSQIDVMPRPTGISRHDDNIILVDTTEYSIDQIVDHRLKEHTAEMRAILDEALKQKRPIFNLRLFEGRFFSPQIGGGDDAAEEKEVTWGKTAVNGLREGLKFTVKSLTSVAISGMVLYASNYAGHLLRPDVVPAPSTVVAAVVEQFKNVEMEVSGEGVKLTAKKEDAADDVEAKRLLDDIGGKSAPIDKQKALVKYLESKYAEGLVTGFPIVRGTVVDKVKAMVKENEEGLASRVKEAVTKSVAGRNQSPKETTTAELTTTSPDISMSH